MELLQLYYFRELAMQEHLTNTANKLLISPPSLSAAISRLEQELGVTLFDRVGRRIQLNECGKAYLKYVNIALNAIEDAPKELADISSVNSMSLSVGVTMPSVWGKVFYQFFSLYPEIDFSFTTLKLSDLNNKDVIDKYDLFLAEKEDFTSGNWDYQELGLLEKDECLCFAAPQSHPLSSRDRVSFEEIKDEKLFLFAPEFAARRAIDRMYASFNCKPNISLEHDYSLDPNQYQNLSARLINSTLKNTKKYSHLKFIDIVESTPYVFNYAIGWQKSRYHSRAATLFWDFVVQYCYKNK